MQKPAKPRSNCTGVTFVEILLALVLFVVCSIGIIGAHLAMSSLADFSTQNMRATSDILAIVEHIQATPFASITANFPAGITNGGAANPYGALVGGYTLADERITVTYPAQAANRLEMLITLNWTHKSRARSAVISTIRVDA